MRLKLSYATQNSVKKKKKLTSRLTSHANDFVSAKSHAREKPMLAGYLFPFQSFHVDLFYFLVSIFLVEANLMKGPMKAGKSVRKECYFYHCGISMQVVYIEEGK